MGSSGDTLCRTIKLCTRILGNDKRERGSRGEGDIFCLFRANIKITMCLRPLTHNEYTKYFLLTPIDWTLFHLLNWYKNSAYIGIKMNTKICKIHVLKTSPPPTTLFFFQSSNSRVRLYCMFTAPLMRRVATPVTRDTEVFCWKAIKKSKTTLSTVYISRYIKHRSFL